MCDPMNPAPPVTTYFYIFRMLYRWNVDKVLNTDSEKNIRILGPGFPWQLSKKNCQLH